jgi:hypothetical protein
MANAAATAAIVAGREARAWLAATQLRAWLTSHEGTVRLLGGWPAADGGQLPDPRPRAALPELING